MSLKLDHDALLRAYRQMQLIRCFEERMCEAIKTGEIAGFTHLYAGQEAVAVGVCEHLQAGDTIISTHRGHGHCIAKGCDITAMMKEIYGCRDGLCKGKGGSMHIADVNKGMLGANGIVGANSPIAVGAALSAKLEGKGNLCVAFSGDGACNQGTTFEAMNFAVVTQAPVVFVFENNHYSEHTGWEYAVGTEKDIASRAQAFGMPAWRGDGCDFFSVYEVMAEVLEHVRAGKGPASVEFDTERFYGHYEGDPQNYRGDGELERLRAERDALQRFRQRAVAEEVLSSDQLDAIDEEVTALIDGAQQQAQSGPRPSADDVLQDVYVSY